MHEKSVETKTVSKGVASSSAVKLTNTANTALRFEPILHEGGVKGRLIKYKKSPSKKWSELDQSDFKSHTLNAMEKVVVDLNTMATAKLLEALGIREEIVKKGIQDGRQSYVVAEKEKALVIDDQNKLAILKKILSEGLSDEYWQLISKNQPDLADRLAAGRIHQVRTAQVSELKDRLKSEFRETSGPDSWQEWIFKHHWLFGANYQTPIEKQKINIQGVMPDYLFPRIDGFVDLLEIKLPQHSVIRSDPSHPGSYCWTAETTKAIGQVVFYLSEIDRNQADIERHINDRQSRSISMLKPRAYILIGDSSKWSARERDGLRRLNATLHGIEVLTYQELINRGEAYLSDTNPNGS